ncbi:hypothetical protein [Larkinella terrae]|uniref:Outer membrane beta-barrel protein n=1 Tax=Larkinella terrae TaxID=2025311 RepID=A0A7K0EME7_9BACT|nr:hypothetical protein [Larkinella terrae]MRS62984.1 hypothetical protein [Larkinella terrae]
MKKAAALAICLYLTHASLAQTEVGRALWSGNLQVNTTQLAGDYPNGYTRRSPQVNFSVNHGVFLANNWLMGISANGSYYKQVNFNEIPLNQNYVRGGLSAYVRKYWGATNWRIYAGGGIGGSLDQYRLEVYDSGTSMRSENKTNTFQIAPFTQIGGVYFLDSHWGLELSTNSTVFPFTFSSLTAGLVYMTGRTRPEREIQAGTPPTVGSQARAGRFTVGASVVFTGRTEEISHRSSGAQSLMAAPAVGFFVANNFLVGISVPITWINNSGVSKTTETTLGFAPYVRAYLSNTRLRPYVGATFTYTSYSFRQSPYPSEQVNHTAGGTLNGGLAYLLGKNFIAEANLLNLNVSKQTQNNLWKNGLWLQGLQVTTSPAFTVQYVF